MYATRSDLVARFTAAEVESLGDDPRIDARLADACAEINARLYPVYEIPLVGGPWPQLRAIACEIARYLLYDDEAPDRVERGASYARKRLTRLAEGTGLVDAGGAPPARRPLAQATAPTPALTRDALSDG